MKIKVARIVSFVVLTFLMIHASNAQSRRVIQVSGRAVDQNGVAVKNVTATLYSPPCRNCMDHILPANSSFPDGVFFVDSTPTSRTRFVLYLEENVPFGFWSPFGGPPFDDLAHLQEFRGLPIRPSKGSSRIDLGDVQVKIRFGKVILQMPEAWKDLAAESTTLWLRLRDRTGTTIYDGQLPKTTATSKSNTVKLALTPGRWKVQLEIRQNGHRSSSDMKSVVVRAGSCTVQPLTKLAIGQPCTN